MNAASVRPKVARRLLVLLVSLAVGLGGSLVGVTPSSAASEPAVAVSVAPAEGGQVTAPQDSVTPVAYAAEPAPEPQPEPEPEPAVPTITVSKTTELNGAGETITVTGSGFLPDAPSTSGTRPPLAGKFGGAYAVFGKFADTWRPSENAPSSARKNGDQKFLVHAQDLAMIGGVQAGGAVVAPDGTFAVDLRVAKGFAGEPATGNYGVYTYSGSGAKHAAFETFTPISFAASPTALTFTTSPSDQVTEGGAVTLRAALDSPVAGSVTFSTATTMLGTVAADASGVAELIVPSLAVGAHALKAVFTPTDTATHATSAATRVFTVVAKPVAPAVAPGSLTWGFKQAFRAYLTGPIAHGSIITTGAGTSGGAFVFGQAGGGSFDGSTGTSAYSGSVRFLGHGGILDLSLSNPVVRVDSASSGTLLVSVNGGGSIPFATLALGSGSRSVANGAVSYSGVPATLTAQGAAAFVYGGSQFYPAGTSLDPVSFVIGSPRAIGGGTTTIAAYTPTVAPVPSTPPATTGVTIQTPLEQLAEGAEITITADGFQPNETGIKIVIYSDPIVLATDVTADGRGAVTWTGALPAGLTGKHTLTMQGSVDRGVELTIADPMMRTMQITSGCVVSDASLTWGFKEAFRSYISGAIAHGKWTVADGATYETPSFGWNSGSGTYDAAGEEGLIAFQGSVQFTGHGGVLNTTISNPQLRFDGDGKATLLLDVAGDTRDGVAVDQRGVEFATIDLAAAEKSGSDGEVEFAGAPAVLTAAGSAAFGTYEAGSELDPITVVFSAADGCAAPPAEAGDDDAPIADEDAGTGWIIWAAIAGVLAALAAAAWFLIARRRRAA